MTDFTTPDPIRDNELAIRDVQMILDGILNPDSVYVTAAEIAEGAAKSADPIRELRDTIIRVALTTIEIVGTLDDKSKRRIVSGLMEGQLRISVQNIGLEVERGDL